VSGKLHGRWQFADGKLMQAHLFLSQMQTTAAKATSGAAKSESSAKK